MHGFDRSRKKVSALAVLVFFLSTPFAFASLAGENGASSDVTGLYLTWQQDPTTTMTIAHTNNYWHQYDETYI